MRATWKWLTAGLAMAMMGCAAQPAGLPQMTDIAAVSVPYAGVSATDDPADAPADVTVTESAPTNPPAQGPGLAGAPGGAGNELEVGGVGAERRIVHGPGDPIYREVQVPGGSEALAVRQEGPFRFRAWAPAKVGFVDGRIRHMPRWFADPQDDVEQPLGTMGPDCRDVAADACSIGRFLVNIGALPVSMVMHPCCGGEVSDRTATIVQTGHGLEIQDLGNP